MSNSYISRQMDSLSVNKATTIATVWIAVSASHFFEVRGISRLIDVSITKKHPAYETINGSGNTVPGEKKEPLLLSISGGKFFWAAVATWLILSRS